ncbi:hypothetical protein DFH06DRAFT_1222879 [Mycena polygramma]|nr:hypothetical protein DFH06DRAFT_1222879 [Mycena polygramma]
MFAVLALGLRVVVILPNRAIKSGLGESRGGGCRCGEVSIGVEASMVARTGQNVAEEVGAPFSSRNPSSSCCGLDRPTHTSTRMSLCRWHTVDIGAFVDAGNGLPLRRCLETKEGGVGRVEGRERNSTQR